MKLLIITQKVDREDPILGFFHRWIIEFSKHAESVIVICLYQGQYQFPANVRVFSLGKEKRASRSAYLINFTKIIWRERKNYDSVFVHMNQIYVVLAGLWWRITGKKIGLWYTHKNVSVSLRVAVLLSHVVFTASKESFRISGDKVKPTGHGIDTDMFVPLSNTNNTPSTFRIITVGRISPVKGYDVLLHAMSELQKKNVDFHLNIVGGSVTNSDIAYEAKLHEEVNRLNIKDRVTFIGPISNNNIVPYLQNSDVFINLSATGGLDKAVLEAMAVGLPVVTSNETFKHVLDKYNLMCTPGDPVSVARILEDLYRDRERSKTIGTQLRREVISHHKLSNLIVNIVNLYSQLSNISVFWKEIFSASIPDMFKKLSELILFRYVVSGGTAAVVDLLLLYLLNIVVGLHYIPAAILAFLGAFSVSFILQKFWTFRNTTKVNMHLQAIAYLVSSLGGLGLNTLLMYIFVDYVHLHVIIAQIFAGIIVAFFSFFISRNLIFKVKSI